MLYTPKQVNGNVNVSKKSLLKEFFLLLGGILGIFLIIYIGLGFALEGVVHKLPPKAEERLGDFFSNAFKDEENIEAEAKLQEFLDGIAKEVSADKSYYSSYTVHIIDKDETVNALAYPGGNIIVLSGLLKEMHSENELVFVLAHELGHFANRDHLKGLGRGLVLFAMSAVLFGDSTVTSFLQKSLANVEMQFSQHQEAMADMFALDLLNKKYGHVAGATDFFDTILEKEKIPRFAYFFATHPYPEDRKKALENQIREKGYILDDTFPLDPALKNISLSTTDS